MDTKEQFHPQGPFRCSLLKHFLFGHRNITAITISRTIRTPFLNINEAVASSILIAFNRVYTRVWKSFLLVSVNRYRRFHFLLTFTKLLESRSIIGQVECGWSRWLWFRFSMILVKRLKFFSLVLISPLDAVESELIWNETVKIWEFYGKI